MSSPREPSTPPPVIGKIGPYTVFLTPPTTTTTTSTVSATATSAVVDSPKKVAVHAPPPPVQPPPAQFYEPSNDRFGFLRDALTKVQNVHASIDEFMANWLGLNQSKFQWALDDYYEAKGMGKGDVTKEVSSKRQTV